MPRRDPKRRGAAPHQRGDHLNSGDFGLHRPLHFFGQDIDFSNNDDDSNTFYPWNKKVRQNTRLYLLSLDFITPELSQTELNRFFWLISDDPKS
ncbi:MAG: hypothetical protein Q8R70_09410, partial [Methanoregula sp.]|nr:hypothetical protein [Methanoregula sp.]